jgi:tripartite motif-containing protein 71
MTFNIMLDDENSFFETNSPRLDTPQFVTPGQPSVDYAAKTKAKLIIGKQGREHCEFVWPIDVALNTFNGQILVADSGNHRIQIFESNGKFVKAFGKLGCQNGQMNTVSGLYMDAMSNIFVVDRLNHSK